MSMTAEVNPERRHLHRPETGACIPGEQEPIAEQVDHCNPRTDYDLIQHVYQPDDCSECGRIAALYAAPCSGGQTAKVHR